MAANSDGDEEGGAEAVPAPVIDLWAHLVGTWRALGDAVAAVGLRDREVADHEHLRRLCRRPPPRLRRAASSADSRADGESAAGAASPASARSLGSPGTPMSWVQWAVAPGLDEKAVLQWLAAEGRRSLHRSELLQMLSRCPPRQRFADWANAMLLHHATALELWKFLAAPMAGRGNRRSMSTSRLSSVDLDSTSDQPLALSRQSLLDAMAICEVHGDDAAAWVELLEAEEGGGDGDSVGGVIGFGILARRMLADPNFASDASVLELEDIAVRLVHCWGDLCSAFAVPLPAPLALGIRRQGAASPGAARPPPASRRACVPRASSVRELVEAATLRQPEPRPRCISAEQWAHALRGSTRVRLWPEAVARREARRLVASTARVAEDTAGMLLATFPNVSERLCVARTVFHPREPIVVRYAADDAGLLGYATAALRRPLGAAPFVAVVPLAADDEELPPAEGCISATGCAALGAAPRGTVTLRAPDLAYSGGVRGLWAVRLFSSDDGVTPLAAIGRQVSVRVRPPRPMAVGEPFVVAAAVEPDGSRSLTVSWDAPGLAEHGGAPPEAHEVAAWIASDFHRGLEPKLAVAGVGVLPPLHVSGLEPATDYIFRVRYRTEAGVAPWSRPSAPGRTPPLLPEAPGRPEVYCAPEALEDGFQVMLRFAAPLGEVTGYEVSVHQRSSEAPTRIERIAGAPAGDVGLVRATVGGLNGSSTYTFSIRACNTAGAGPPSLPSDRVQTFVGPPGVPSPPVQAWAEADAMTLAWDAPANDGGSAIVRYYVRGVEEAVLLREESSTGHRPTRVSGRGAIEALTRDSSMQLTIKRLRANTRYVFQVCALNGVGLSAYSALSVPLSTGRSAPSPPQNVTVVEAKATSLDVSWDAPENDGGHPIDHYTVSWWSARAPAAKLNLSTASCAATLAGLAANAEYILQVQAVNAEGPSEATQLRSKSGACPPSRLWPPEFASEPGVEVDFVWEAPEDDGGATVAGYELEVRPFVPDEDSHRACRFIVQAAGTRARFDGLVPGHAYDFRVRARNRAGPGDWSETSRAMLVPLPPPAPEAPTAASASARSMRVAWAAPPMATAVGKAPLMIGPEGLDSLVRPVAATPSEYEVVALKDGCGVEGNSSLRSTETDALFKGLQQHVPYSFRVRALGPGGWSEWSPPSAAQVTADTWTHEEILSAIQPHCANSLSRAFRALECDTLGFVTFEEFSRGLDQVGLGGMCLNERARLFQDADTQDLGRIGVHGFTRCLLARHEAPTVCGSHRARSPRSPRSPSPKKREPPSSPWSCLPRVGSPPPTARRAERTQSGRRAAGGAEATSPVFFGRAALAEASPQQRLEAKAVFTPSPARPSLRKTARSPTARSPSRKFAGVLQGTAASGDAAGGSLEKAR